jgi:hypothetical protein
MVKGAAASAPPGGVKSVAARGRPSAAGMRNSSLAASLAMGAVIGPAPAAPFGWLRPASASISFPVQVDVNVNADPTIDEKFRASQDVAAERLSNAAATAVRPRTQT